MSDKGLGTETICQVAIVVRDIDQAARAWADVLGVDVPEARLTDPADKTNIVYRGEPTEGRAKLAFFRTGAISLELIQPVGGPSTWQEFLDTSGEGVHHVAFRVEAMDDVLAFLNARGLPTVQHGDYTGGRYAYVDARAKLKTVLELLENRSGA